MDALKSLSVAELKEDLKARGLPVSGRKAELIERLQQTSPNLDSVEQLTLDAEMVVMPPEETALRRGVESLLSLPLPVIIVVGLVVTGSLGYAGYELVSAFLDDEVEYPELIDFDATRTRGYTETLLSYGHAQWEGRMSGSQEELNAAQYIRDTFESLGYEATLENLTVPMFSVVSAPTLRLCIPGGTPFVPPCSPLDTGQQIIEYEHRTEVVLQGFSGTRTINFGQAEVVDLGEGGEEENWQGASGNIGVVFWDNAGVSGNTQIYSLAAQYDVAALIVINTGLNCGKVEADNCVPIFKSINVDEVVEANGGTMPDDISFVMISSNAGAEIMDAVNNESGLLSISTNVQNTGELDVRVPCGRWQGITDDLLIVGGHHDTVYHGPGAVDDTSGTATVMELATVFSEILTDGELPYYTMMFCTWGGEEEGLWGSKAWVEKHQDELQEHLRLYVNLDMNHVDIDMDTRGNGVYLFSNSKEDLDHIKEITKIYEREKSAVASKYQISFRLLDGEKNGENAMPYNSDHGPFVYDLGEENGKAIVCYGTGSWEYHTYADDMSRFNEESLSVSGTIYGTYLRFLAEV